MRFKPEYIALTVNLLSTFWYIYQAVFITFEPGKIVYWLGATLITVSLLFMKG